MVGRNDPIELEYSQLIVHLMFVGCSWRGGHMYLYRPHLGLLLVLAESLS